MSEAFKADPTLPILKDGAIIDTNSRVQFKLAGAGGVAGRGIRMTDASRAIYEVLDSDPLLTGSHVCGNAFCANLKHIVPETLGVNKSRDACHAQQWINRACEHEPKCLLKRSAAEHAAAITRAMDGA